MSDNKDSVDGDKDTRLQWEDMMRREKAVLELLNDKNLQGKISSPQIQGKNSQNFIR